jgi:hypothetical protein
MAKGKQARAAVLSKKDAQTGVFSDVMPSDANLFNLLKGNHIMEVVNVISFL